MNRQNVENDKQIVDVSPLEKFLRTSTGVNIFDCANDKTC